MKLEKATGGLACSAAAKCSSAQGERRVVGRGTRAHGRGRCMDQLNPRGTLDHDTPLPPDPPRFYTEGFAACRLAPLARAIMVNNMPVKTLVHKDLTIEGYSRAAVQTYWRIPELKIGFDLGGQPWSFMGTGTWFVSHAHLDHLAALPVYVARRRMMKMEPPTIYLPEPADRAGREDSQAVHAARPRADALRAAADRAGQRDRAVARARGDRLGDGAHGAVAGIRRLGAAAEAQGRVPESDRAADSRPAAGGHRRDRGAPRGRGSPTWATARRRGSTPARRCTRPRC